MEVKSETSSSFLPVLAGLKEDLSADPKLLSLALSKLQVLQDLNPHLRTQEEYVPASSRPLISEILQKTNELKLSLPLSRSSLAPILPLLPPPTTTLLLKLKRPIPRPSTLPVLLSRSPQLRAHLFREQSRLVRRRPIPSRSWVETRRSKREGCSSSEEGFFLFDI